MCKSTLDIYKRQNTPQRIQIGDGNGLEVEFIEYLDGEITDAFGHKKIITLKQVSYVPTLKYNLFIPTTSYSEAGMKLISHGRSYRLSNKKLIFDFDIIFDFKMDI